MVGLENRQFPAPGGLSRGSRPTTPPATEQSGLATLDESERVCVRVVDELPEVLVDAALVERAFANVLANAFAFSPPGDTVTVIARVAGNQVEVRVADHGPGVQVEDRKHVFQPFQRLGDDHHAGIGLGLAVTKGFMRAVGGDVALDETPGGGLTVVLSLPIADGATGGDPSMVQRSASPPGSGSNR
jgi:two-component system sensor histidine kinase KdpD